MKTGSITHIKEKAKRKTNPDLVATIESARKNKAWLSLAHKLSSPSRNHLALNLKEIDSKAKAGDTIIIVGKVLSSGNLTKKVKIVSLSISAQAKDKLKETKSEYSSILNEIKSNPKATGVKIL